jgi:hypothetical protein
LDRCLLLKRPALPLTFDPSEIAESNTLTSFDNEWVYSRERGFKEDEDDEEDEEDDWNGR